MEEIICFDYKLYREQCNESIYKDPNLISAIDTLLETTYANSTTPSERIGKAVSTVGSDFNILHLPEIRNLAEWIVSQIMTIDEFRSKNSNTFDFTRHWANRIYKDCNGLCHTHPKQADAVAIFYLDVPEGGSDLVIINNGKEDSNYLEYGEKDRHDINVESGTLIIHKPDVPHAVSIHNSTDPRTCLIFEFKIAEEIYEN